jgi:thiamine pyrophosphate-dependent acetolactate synthase large subunit-like protein
LIVSGWDRCIAHVGFLGLGTIDDDHSRIVGSVVIRVYDEVIAFVDTIDLVFLIGSHPSTILLTKTI